MSQYIRPTFAAKSDLSPRGQREAALAIHRVRGAHAQMLREMALIYEQALGTNHPTTVEAIRAYERAQSREHGRMQW